jgi:hypothetical protein
VIVNVSPFWLVTTHRSGDTTRVFGAFIQFSGLYAPPSAWTATQPSALTMISRVASGRWADRRPV